MAWTEYITPTKRQEEFLASPFSFVLFGGSAGGGKSAGLLLDPIRYLTKVEGFHGIIFQRTFPQIEKSLLKESLRLYPLIGGKLNQAKYKWIFPPYGNTLSFSHLQQKKDVLRHQGAAYCFIGFDELTQFEAEQVIYLMSRNRSTCGVKPYIRATCNPDRNWVRDLVLPYLTPDGYPDPNLVGKRSLITVENNKFVHTTDEAIGKSFTFIPAKLSDNPHLLKADPGYIINLQNQSAVDRARLLDGNWNVVEKAGSLFQPEWFRIIRRDQLPEYYPDPSTCIRAYDLAATARNFENQDPDCTASVKMVKIEDRFFILDVTNAAISPDAIEKLIIANAHADGNMTAIRWEMESTSAGRRETSLRKSHLGKFNALGVKPHGDKAQRAKPLSAIAEQGRLFLVEAGWNNDFINQLVQFPDLCPHDDMVDAACLAVNYLIGYNPITSAPFIHL